MRCPQCGKRVKVGEARCRSCGAALHYGGNTEFVGKAAAGSLKITDLFDGTFKKHTKGAGARMFMAGTPLSTPEPRNMLDEWEKPWIYIRVLGIGILFSFLSYFMAEYLGHPLGVYLLFTLCALVFPISILMFFWEINIPRNIPLYNVLLTFFIGGILSLIFTLLIPIEFSEDYYAPLAEEPAKVIAVALFIYILKPRYIFGGLLIGAAVGAGFAAFENISYVMMYSSFDLLIMRSLHSFGGHTMWAAIEGGALLIAMGSSELKAKHFISKDFLMYFAASVVMHMIWNMPISVLPLPLVADVKYIILIGAAIAVVFIIIRKALQQVIETVDAAGSDNGGSHSKESVILLTASGGIYGGQHIPISGTVKIGYDPDRCNLVLPKGSPGVSGLHCTLRCSGNTVYIMDNRSRYGTFFKSGRRLPQDKWVPVTESFYMGSNAVMYTVIIQQSRL